MQSYSNGELCSCREWVKGICVKRSVTEQRQKSSSSKNLEKSEIKIMIKIEIKVYVRELGIKINKQRAVLMATGAHDSIKRACRR